MRNRNYARDAWSWGVIALGLLVVNVASNFGLEWLGVALVAAPTALAALEVVIWRRTFLTVLPAGVLVGRLFRQRFFRWDEIVGFEILAPEQRTPLRLTFVWSSIDGRARMRDGSTYRIPAIQPRVGLSALAYFSVSRWGDADNIVEDLNRILLRRQREAQRHP